MKNLNYILLLLVIFFLACEQIIDVDLNDAAPAIVIEGNVGGIGDTTFVKITKTSSYFNDSPSEKISGANVMVIHEDGNLYDLLETTDGVYESTDVKLVNGTEYSLKVEVVDNIYEATSLMNQPVLIDSLSYYFEEGYAFMEEGYVVNTYFHDPLDVENYYRVKLYINGKIVDSGFILFNDRFIDGQYIEINLSNENFTPDDTVSVQLISLDENVFDYYQTFDNLLNTNPGSAAPANPNSNLSNGALGYFSAYSFDLKSIIIEDLE